MSFRGGVTTVDGQSGAVNLSGAYVARNGALASIVRDSAGRITSLVDNTVTESYTRDPQGRIATITVGSTTRTVSRDASGRVTGVA